MTGSPAAIGRTAIRTIGGSSTDGLAETAADDLAFLRSDVRPTYEGGSGEVTMVDLFSGCGGMTLGMAHAAHLRGSAVRIPLAVDEDVRATRVYQHNFPEAFCVPEDVCEWFDGQLDARLTAVERRVRARVGKGIDILVGGPPCQGNSNLNNHTRRNDPRNALYARMARAARVLEARLVILENVPAVVQDRGGVVDATVRALKRAGYRVHHDMLDLWIAGVPQHRKRHLLIASRRERRSPILPKDVFAYLNAENRGVGRDVRWAIEDLLDLTPDGLFDVASIPNEDNARRMRWLIDKDRYELPNDLRPFCHRNDHHSYKSIYGRLHWNLPAPTITTGFGSTGQGRNVHPARPRTITPHEAARLQGFPDFFDFYPAKTRTSWAQLIGNAVPPLLTLRIGEYVLDRLVGAHDAQQKGRTPHVDRSARSISES